MGGLAVAKLIAGEFSPSGRLPITFYHADDELPDITDYSMKNRTYRFYNKKPLYPFGYGLSFTSFEFNNPTAVKNDSDTVVLTAEVKNTGACDSAVKVQCYAHYEDSRTETPRLQLCGITPLYIKKGETKTAEIIIDKFKIATIAENLMKIFMNYIHF